MNNFDDLRKEDLENVAWELVEKKACAQRMESAQKMYDDMVRRCLRELGEYWYGTTRGWIFSSENYEIKNVCPGEWYLHRKYLPDCHEGACLFVRYTEEPGSKSCFSTTEVIRTDTVIRDKTKDISEKELRELLVRIAEKYRKPSKN